MADTLEIDLDGEQVLFDGTWYSKEELARKIKTMVDSGDYRVSRPSAALEGLQNALSGLRTISVRLPAELAEQLATAAARQNKPVGAFVREALGRSVAPRPTMGSSPSMLVTPIALSQAMASNEPATAEEAVTAIPLTPKRQEGEPAGDNKPGWFDRK